MNNLKAVPRRPFGNLACVSDDLIKVMHQELSLELLRLDEDLRELGKKRNGLEHIERELELRGFK